MKRHRTPAVDVGNGKVEMELFGSKVVIKRGKGYRKPTPKGKIKAYHLVKGADVPEHLRVDVANYLAIATRLGIKHGKITVSVAEYLMKGYNEMAQQQAAA